MKKQLSILLLSTAVLLAGCSHRTSCSGNTDCHILGRCGSCGIVVKDRVVLERPAHFAFDSYELTQNDINNLNAIAKRLHENPSEKIRINGYTDNTGTDAYNMKLGQERAMVVAHYLVDKGVAMNRMEIQSMGATEFVAPNTTAAGRAKNRRTEILFYE